MSTSGPLNAVRVLDLTSIVMGPFATQILAQLGADVIKVESKDGDDMRRVGPMRSPSMGSIFLQANQGKRSVVLDLKTGQGIEALSRLIARADVFVTNIRPGALSRLALDYESVRKLNESIIFVSCCGFDPTGPYADKPAYDDLIQGAACVPWLMERYGSPNPSYVPFALADRVAGLHAVYGITAALYSRAITGVGQAIAIPMFESLAQFILGDHLGGLAFYPVVGDAGYSRLLTPHRRPYQTADGYLCVLVYNDKHWKKFFEAIGESDRLGRDLRFSSHTLRASNIASIYEELSALMLTKTTAEWRSILDEVDVPNMPMNTPEELLRDSHLEAIGFIRDYYHPTEGHLRMPVNPTKWFGTPLSNNQRPAPALGEHTSEVLSEIGYSKSELAKFEGTNVT